MSKKSAPDPGPDVQRAAVSSAVVPIVRYLRLDPEGAHLVAQSCDACAARFFDVRLSCARCGGRTFSEIPVARTGTIGSFTIVHRAAKGIPTPFVSVLVDLVDGTTVKSTLVNCTPDPEHVHLHARVRLTTYPVATDDEGVTAVAFGFEPSDGRSGGEV